MSSEDIKKGAAWDPALTEALAGAKAGIICLTPDNLVEPWLLFEAGAIYNTPWHANVCTYLLGVTNSALPGPFTRFQWTVSIDKQENRKLLDTINSTLGDRALEQKRLDKAFDSKWPEFEEGLRQISTAHPAETPTREVTDMVEETLNIVRGLQKQSAEPPKPQPVYYTIDSSPNSSPALSPYERALGILGVGAPGANVIFFPGGSSSGPTGYTQSNLEALYGVEQLAPRQPFDPGNQTNRKKNRPPQSTAAGALPTLLETPGLC
jgi:hypothetical protein